MAADSRRQQKGRAGKGAGDTGVHNATVGKNGKDGGAKRTSNLRPSIASKIRGVERFLARPNLPDEIRIAQEAKLQQLLQQKAARNMTAAEKKVSRRYKMVRFAEKVKLQRRLRSAQRGLDEALAAVPEDPAAIADLHEKVANLQANLDYVVNFPPGEKYVSVLVDPEGAADLERVEAERLRLRGMVNDIMGARAAASAERQAKLGKKSGAVLVAPPDGGVVDMDPDDIGMIVFDDDAVGAAAPGSGGGRGTAVSEPPGVDVREDAGEAPDAEGGGDAARGRAGVVADAAAGAGARPGRGAPAGAAGQMQGVGTSSDESDADAPVHPDDVDAFAPTARRRAAPLPKQEAQRQTAAHGVRSGKPTEESDSDGPPSEHPGPTAEPPQAGARPAPVPKHSVSDGGSSAEEGGEEDAEGDDFFADGGSGGDGSGEEPPKVSKRRPPQEARIHSVSSQIKKRQKLQGKGPGKQVAGKWGGAGRPERKGGPHSERGREGGGMRNHGSAGFRPKERRLSVDASSGGVKQITKLSRENSGTAATGAAAPARGRDSSHAGEESQPKRSRAEGGRKRRNKK